MDGTDNLFFQSQYFSNQYNGYCNYTSAVIKFLPVQASTGVCETDKPTVAIKKADNLVFMVIIFG